MRAPFKGQIKGFIDTGSDINCINEETAKQFRTKLKKCRPLTVTTGSGYFRSYRYLDVILRSQRSRWLRHRFYVAEKLPHRWLFGRPTQATMMRLIVDPDAVLNDGDFYHHSRQNVEHVEDDISCYSSTAYPVENEQIDLSQLKCTSRGDFYDFLMEELVSYRDVLASNEMDVPEMHDAQFRIEHEEGAVITPFVAREYALPQQHLAEIQRQIDHLLKAGFIRRSSSPWRHATFVVPKANGEARIVFDYRPINKVTKRMEAPLPRIEELMYRFQGAEYITSLDMKSGYWHIPVREEDKEKLAFAFNGNLYEWNRMPFGPRNAPAYFQQTMNKIFHDMRDFVAVYIDDIQIISKSMEEHKDHVRRVLQRLKEYRIKLRIDKCEFGMERVKFLGFLVDRFGVEIMDKTKQKVFDFPRPTNRKEVQRFLGLVNYLRKFIPNLHKLTKTIQQLAHKDKKWEWTDVQESEFAAIQSAVEEANFLLHPDETKHFYILCDASIVGVGGVLAQKDENGELRPIAFVSKKFTETQQRWHVSEQEAFAVIHCIEHWRRLLLPRKFTVYTDHKNLQILFERSRNFKSGKLFRWAVRLQDYDFVAIYLKGSENVMADYLSRDAVRVPDNPQLRPLSPSRIEDKDILMSYMGCLAMQSICDQEHDLLAEYGEPDEILHTRTQCFALSKQSKNKRNRRREPVDQTKVRRSRRLAGKESEGIIASWDKPKPRRKARAKRALPAKSPSPVPDPPQDSAESDPDSDLAESMDVDSDSDDSMVSMAVSEQPRRSPSKRKRAERSQFETETVDDYFDVDNDVDVAEIEQRYLHMPPSKPHRQQNQSMEELSTFYDKLCREVKKANKSRLNAAHRDYSAFNKDLLEPPSPIFDYFNDENDIDLQTISSKQTEDPFCFAVIQMVSEGNPAFLDSLPRYYKDLVASGRFIYSTDNVLFFAEETGEDSAHEDTENVYHRSLTREDQTRKKRLKIVLPASMRYSFIEHVHNVMLHSDGHSMHSAIRNRYWWPRMQRELKQAKKQCETCQRHAGSRADHGKMQLFSAKKPFEMVSIDIVGPLPVTKTKNRYIITMIDRFSRYCMLQPAKTVTAYDVVQAMEHWIAIFGRPKKILSDNGSQFISQVYKEYHEANGTKLAYTTTYNPSTNGMIERLHRWIKERLCLISFDAGCNFVEPKDDWSAYLPVIQHVYNTRPNRMLGYAPTEIIFGRNFVEPLAPKNNDDAESESDAVLVPMETRIQWFERRRAIIHNRALMNQENYDSARKRHFDRKRKEPVLKVGDLVLYDTSSERIGNERKLQIRWDGPFEVAAVHPNNVELRDIDADAGGDEDGRTRRVHVRKVKLYNPHLRSLTMSQQARTEQREKDRCSMMTLTVATEQERKAEEREKEMDNIPRSTLMCSLRIRRKQLNQRRYDDTISNDEYDELESITYALSELRL